MKILHVFKTFYPESYGGIEYVIRTLCENKALDDQCRVIVLSTKGTDYCLHHDAYEVYFYKTNFVVAQLGFSWSFFREFKKHAQWADVIHFHYPWPVADLCNFLYPTQHKIKVLTYHSDIVVKKSLYLLYKPLERRFLRDMDVIVATSENYAHNSHNLKNLSQEKLKIIPIGINAEPRGTDDFVENKRKFSFIDEKYFLFVGVLRYYKGVDILLKALQNKELRVVIAGGGIEFANYKALADKLHLKNIYFLGEVTEQEKHELFKHAYAFVFPSNQRSEAFGIGLVEASSYALPLITCEIGTGTSFINLHEKTGLVVKPNDVRALCEAMQTIWTNPELAEKFGKNARERFLQQFTSTKMVNEYNKVYTHLMGYKSVNIKN